MPRHRRARFVALTSLLSSLHPGVDTAAAIREGRVLVDGWSITNPGARVRHDAAIRLRPERRLKGEIKLAHALEVTGVDVTGRIALDVGASAGGFTTALLAAGARRVYAVDVGVGQLLGSLRLDPRVVNLEGHNLAELTPADVLEPIDLVTMDVSYLAVARAVPQLSVAVRLAPHAQLIVLVKPTFELRRAELASDPADVAAAVDRATSALGRAGWTVLGTVSAPCTGRAGAVEVFIHACRAAGRGSAPLWAPVSTLEPMAASLSRAEQHVLGAVVGDELPADPVGLTDAVRRRTLHSVEGTEFRQAVASLAERGLLRAQVSTKPGGTIGRVVIEDVTPLGRAVMRTLPGGAT